MYSNSIKENNRLVPVDPLHMYESSLLMRGETVSDKKKKNLPIPEKRVEYDMQIKRGKTKICIVAPPPMTQDEIDKVLSDYYSAAWSIIESITERKSS